MFKNVGCSEYTESKNADFAKFAELHVSICQRVFERNTWASPVYQYIDMTAGPGYNPKTGNASSPVLMLSILKRRKMKHRSHFIERDEKTFASLRLEISERFPSANLYHGESRDLTPRIVAALPRASYGMLYCDPNPDLEGMEGFETIAEICRSDKMNTIDVMCYVSATSIKRIRKVREYPTLREMLKNMKKDRWIVRRKIEGDPQQWTLCFGTNYEKIGAWEKRGFHCIDSKRGKAILQELDRTKDELELENQERQLSLF